MAGPYAPGPLNARSTPDQSPYERSELIPFQGFAEYADSSYALVSVDPGSGEAWFRLYGEQKIAPPRGAGEAAAAPLSHSVARIRLF